MAHCNAPDNATPVNVHVGPQVQGGGFFEKAVQKLNQHIPAWPRCMANPQQGVGAHVNLNEFVPEKATTLNDLQDCPVHSRQAVPHIQMTQLLESLQPIQGPQPFDVAEFQGAECWPQWHQPADTSPWPVLILFQVQVAEVVVVARLNTKPQPAVCNAQELQAAAHIVGHCQLTMTFGKHTATTANTQLQLPQLGQVSQAKFLAHGDPHQFQSHKVWEHLVGLQHINEPIGVRILSPLEVGQHGLLALTCDKPRLVREL